MKKTLVVVVTGYVLGTHLAGLYDEQEDKEPTEIQTVYAQEHEKDARAEQRYAARERAYYAQQQQSEDEAQPEYVDEAFCYDFEGSNDGWQCYSEPQEGRELMYHGEWSGADADYWEQRG